MAAILSTLWMLCLWNRNWIVCPRNYGMLQPGHLDCQFSSVQLSRSVMSNSWRPHGLLHARPLCPSWIPRVYSNSRPSSQWCHPSLFSLTFITRLFSSSLLSAVRVVSSAYPRLLIFLPAIVIPAYVSSSPAFLMTYSAYKLNKRGDNIQPWCTPFLIWNQSVVPCLVLTAASWPA